MLSEGTRKSLSRIRRRATPQVQEAYRSGKISARRAAQLLYLEPSQQLAELDRILATQEKIRHRSRIAAQVIKEHLGRKSKDLVALREDLTRALCSSTNPTHAH
jgi:hypothetical protein